MVIKGKILLWSILLMGALAAALSIWQMWLSPFTDEIFIKSLGTIFTVGTLLSFLVAVDYDLPSSKYKIMLSITVILSTLLAGLLLAQMWLEYFETKTFFKLLATDLILLVLVSFFMVVHEDLGTNKSLKDEHYID